MILAALVLDNNPRHRTLPWSWAPAGSSAPGGSCPGRSPPVRTPPCRSGSPAGGVAELGGRQGWPGPPYTESRPPPCIFAFYFYAFIFCRDFIHLCLALMSTSGEQMPFNIAEVKKIIEPYKEVSHELFRLCKGTLPYLWVQLPVREAFPLKVVKIYLTSTMDDVRLSNLGVLSGSQVQQKPWILVILWIALL